MKKILGWSIAILLVFHGNQLKAADQNKMAIPSEDDLLNFDSNEKQESAPVTPPPKVISPPADQSKRQTLKEIPSMAPPDSESAQDTSNPMLAPPPPENVSQPAPPSVEKLQKKAQVAVPPKEESASPPAIPKNESSVVQSPELSTSVDSEGLSNEDSLNEARLARIFKKYNQSEVGDEQWSKIAGDKMTEAYTLQNGDTLWDISTKFFGNGFYWPKVWQLNDQITNPHNIQTGNTLKFSPGSTVAAPQLAVNQTGERQEEPPPGESGEEVETIMVDEGASGPGGNSQVAIPSASRRHLKVAQIPPSFGEWKSTNNKYDQNGFAAEVVSQQRETPLSAIPSIILEEPWEQAGKIIELEGDTTVASTYQNVIIQSKNTLQKGDMLTVFSDNGTVDDPISGQHVGFEIQTRGEVEVLEPVEGAPETYRGIVIFTAFPIRIGDSIKVGKNISRISFDTQGAASQVSARILNGEFGKRRVLALHNLVYLDKGDQDGLQVGSLLNVLKNVKLRNDNSVVKFDPKPIGILKVAHVDHHVATAVIVEERDAIQPGDETGLVAVADSEPAGPAKLENPDSGDGSDSNPPETEQEANP